MADRRHTRLDRRVFASARALQDGDAVPVIAVTGTAANIAGVAGGIVVFGDPVAASPEG